MNVKITTEYCTRCGMRIDRLPFDERLQHYIGVCTRGDND